MLVSHYRSISFSEAPCPLCGIASPGIPGLNRKICLECATVRVYITAIKGKIEDIILALPEGKFHIDLYKDNLFWTETNRLGSRLLAQGSIDDFDISLDSIHKLIMLS